MGSVWDWSPVANALNNLGQQYVQQSWYNQAMKGLFGSQAPDGANMQGATAQLPPQAPNPPAPLPSGITAQAPQAPSPTITAPSVPALKGVGMTGPLGNMPGGDITYQMLKAAPPSIGFPLLLQTVQKQQERQQALQDSSLTLMTADEKKAAGFRDDAVVYKDVSGNPIVKQQGQLLTPAEITQQQSLAASTPETPYQKDQLKLQNREADLRAAELTKPVSLGMGAQLVDPKTGKVIAGGMSPTSAAPTGPDGTPLTGGAFLKTLPPNIAASVKAIGDYRQQLSPMMMRTPEGMQISGFVNQYNPGFDATQYASKTKARNDFATGKNGNSVRSLNVSIAHLDTLGQLTDALNNGNIPVVNAIGNAWAQQTGSPAPTNFETAKNIVGDEITKAIVGAGGTGADREKAQEVISKANSPAQLKGAIATYQQLLSGQLGGLKRQYETSTGLKDFEDYLSPEVRTKLQGAQPASGAPASAAGSAPHVRVFNPKTGKLE